MTNGHATPPEVIAQIRELAEQGLGLSAIARKLERPKSTVHRIMTVVLKRKSSAPAKPASVSMVNRKKKATAVAGWVSQASSESWSFAASLRRLARSTT